QMLADALDPHHQLPDAPPPPKLPPPPEKPLSLLPDELDPLLQPPPPPPEYEPPDQPPPLLELRTAFWLAAKIASAKNVNTEMMPPERTPTPIESKKYQTMTPIAPPATPDPTNRPSRPREIAPTTKTKKIVKGLSGLRSPHGGSDACEASGAGAGNGSPSTTPIMRETPAAMPPEK